MECYDNLNVCSLMGEYPMTKNALTPETTLKVAIQYETNKYKLYQRTSLKVRNEESLSMLRYLAREERDRIRQLKDMYQHVSGRRLMAINLNGEENIRPKLIFNLYKDPIKILEFAIQNDKEALTYYEDTLEGCVNSDGRKMLEYLAEQKRVHLEVLRMEYTVRQKDSEAIEKRKVLKNANVYKEYILENDPVAQYI